MAKMFRGVSKGGCMPKKGFLALFYVFFMTFGLFAEGMKMESPDISGKLYLSQVYDRYGCHGKNISPELHWYGEPKGTRSFAVTMFDPDAPTGYGWWHWIVCNIPADIHGLPRGAGLNRAKALPKGAVQCKNDYGETGYGGPCPPKGDRPHRYIVTVYALDVAHLPVRPDMSPSLVYSMIEKHTIAKASLTARYGR